MVVYQGSFVKTRETVLATTLRNKAGIISSKVLYDR